MIRAAQVGWNLSLAITLSAAVLTLTGIAPASAKPAARSASAAAGPSAAWNGASAASNLASPSTTTTVDEELLGVSCTSSHNCFSAGYRNAGSAEWAIAAAWNGTTWRALTPLSPHDAKSTVFTSVKCVVSPVWLCMVAGFYVSATNVTQTLGESWNGASWKIHDTPAPAGASISEFQSISCVGSSWCMASGFEVNSSRTDVSLTAVWNGRDWATVATPNPRSGPNPFLPAIACTSSSFCESVGYYSKSNANGPDVTLGDIWNGKTWSIQATPTPAGSSSNDTYGVACLSSANCLSVGFGTAATELHAHGQIWNGKSWTNAATVTTASQSALFGVSCAAPDCMGVGSLSAQWNGKGWADHAIATVAHTTGDVLYGVSCLAPANCLAVGTYQVGSADYLLSETWNGSVWAVKAVPVIN